MCIVSKSHLLGNHGLGLRTPSEKGNAVRCLTYLLPGAQPLQEHHHQVLGLAAPLLAVPAPQLPVERQHLAPLLPRAQPLRQQHLPVPLKATRVRDFE